MDSENSDIRRISWSLMLTVIVFFAPFLYVLASGPMKIVFDNLGATDEMHERAFAPLVWLRNDTPASDVIDWYWGLFPGAYHDEYDAVAKEARGKTDIDTDPLVEWLYSPEAHSINRNLGVSN